MYIILTENQAHISPALYIHSDEDEAMQFIKDWWAELALWAFYDGVQTPLRRLEATSAIVDLVHKLGNYYLQTSGDELSRDGKIQSWIRLMNYDDIVNESVNYLDIKTGEWREAIATH